MDSSPPRFEFVVLGGIFEVRRLERIAVTSTGRIVLNVRSCDARFTVTATGTRQIEILKAQDKKGRHFD
jgi:hypothetical protein